MVRGVYVCVYLCVCMCVQQLKKERDMDLKENIKGIMGVLGGERKRRMIEL